MLHLWREASKITGFTDLVFRCEYGQKKQGGYMLQGRADAVRKISSKTGKTPLGLIAAKRKKQSICRHDICRLAQDLADRMEKGTINIAGTGCIREKSTLCAELCKDLAFLGKRVMFVCVKEFVPDAEVDNREQSQSLQEYLDGECSVRDILSYDRENRVYRITGEVQSGCLTDEQWMRLADLLCSCGGLMDYVIVDGPDMEEGAVADTLAGICDASVLLVSQKKAMADRTVQIIRELEEFSKCFLGYVVCRTRDEWALPAIGQEKISVSGKCKRQMNRAALRKGICHLAWAAPFSVFVFCAVVFIANNILRSICKSLKLSVLWCNPWNGIGAAALVALVVWVLLVCYYAKKHKTIKNAAQARECLGKPFLGSLPGGSLQKERYRTRYERELGKICTKLRVLEQGKVLMVTSTLEGEGKTTFAWNLAEMLSKNGSRVMLIDADVNSQLMSRWLMEKKNVSIPWDLKDLVSKRVTAEKAILQLTQSKAYFLGMTHEMKESVRFLASKELTDMLGAIRESMDYVILDAPPAFFAESEILAEKADAILYTIGYDGFSADEILAGVQRMEKTKTPVIGTVLCREVR